jgi:hypothetical protein
MYVDYATRAIEKFFVRCFVSTWDASVSRHLCRKMTSICMYLCMYVCMYVCSPKLMKICNVPHFNVFLKNIRNFTKQSKWIPLTGDVWSFFKQLVPLVKSCPIWLHYVVLSNYRINVNIFDRSLCADPQLDKFGHYLLHFDAILRWRHLVRLSQYCSNYRQVCWPGDPSLNPYNPPSLFFSLYKLSSSQGSLK